MLPQQFRRYKAVVIVAALLVGCLLLKTASDRIFWSDYGTKPPAQVFKSVTGHAVPQGVSNLRVAGHAFFIKSWVWITFKASTDALKPLIAGQEPMDKDLADVWLSSGYSASQKYDQKDKQVVGWREASSIQRKKVYRVSNFHDSTQWSGYLIVDEDTGTVYIHAGD